MSKLRVTQVRSIIKTNARQKKTVQAFGLKCVHDTVELPDNPQVNGMLVKVNHLVTIEKI